MKIDKLDINKRKIFLCALILGVVLLVTLIVKATWAKYEKSQTISIATGTVNYKYPDYKMIAIKQQKSGQTCTTDNTTCYETKNVMPVGTGYSVNETNSYCTLPNSTTKDSNVKLFTDNAGHHTMENVQTGSRCYLWFDNKPKLLANVIMGQGATTVSSTPTADCKATSCSGFFKQANVNQNGTTGTYYYYRGAVNNNWVKFGGHFWRIISINTDGTVRLIYTGTGSGTSASTSSNVTIENNGVIATGTGTQITYNSANTHKYNNNYNQANYVGWTWSETTNQRPSSSNNDGSTGTKSNAYTVANNWLTSNISSANQTKITAGKFCNDRNTSSGSWPSNPNSSTSFYYAAYDRRSSGTVPSLTCNTGDVYTTKVGLITSDEIRYAGGSYSTNQDYYLYTGSAYWTMSPIHWNGNAQVLFVDTIGNFNGADLHWGVNGMLGIRPVINLSTNATVSGGNGTYTTPYVVS